ncbi:hypothetical protein EMCRGX_G001719 [Ephydatia muelleri]
MGPWLAQVHTYPVGTWNSSESASKCFATHKNGTHLHWYTPTLWVHGTAQSLPQNALQLTRMAPISIGELESTYELWSHPQCSGSTRDVGSLVGAGTHLPCGYMEQLRVCLKVLCNSQEWHPSPLVSLKVLMSCGHTPSVLDLRVTLGPWLAQVHTYPVGTWNSSESASKCFATHKNGTHLHWYTPTLWVHGTAQSLSQSALQLTRMAPISIGTHLPCGYMEQLRVSLKVLCNSQEWHPSPLVSLKVLISCGHTPSVLDPRVTLGPWLAQVHTYPVGTWNSSESASKCFATHKNGTHLHWSACKYLLVVVTPPVFLIRGDVGSLVGTGTHLPCGYMEQLRVCLKVLCNSQEWHPSSLVSLKVLMSCGHTPSVPDPRVTLGPWLAQVHTYPVGTWNSSDSVSKCFATLKNGTHLHWYTPTLWVHGTAQSLSQSALQLTRMAPIFTGQLVHTYSVGTWNSSESASKCFATHKNGTHLHCVQDPRVTLGPWLAQVHTYPVGTWNSSESASKCFATHKNGTHLHWSACTHLPCGYMEQLRVCLKVLCNSQEWHPSPLVSLKVLMSCGHTPSVPDPRVTLGPWLAQVHTYPVGTWNSSESVSKCFATLKNGTHLHWYTPTLWVHGTAQSLPQSALQLTRMAPIFTGQLESTYELWSHPQCSGSTRDVGSLVGAGTHLPCGYMEQLRVCLKVLCNSQEWHPSPLVSLKVLMSCGHTPSVLDLRVTLGPWLAQVHTYPVGTWNSSESASKCFATHKNGTHLHWYTPTLWVHGTAQSLPQSALQLTRMAPIFTGQLVHTYPVGTWNSSESASKCFATHKNGTHLHWYTPTLWVHGTAQILSQSALQLSRMAPISIGELESTYELWSHPQCSGSARDVGSLVGAGTHLPCGYMEQLRVCLKVLCNSQEWHPSSLVSLYTPTLWVHGTAQSLPQSALQLTRMAPISIGDLKVLMSCGHTPSVPDPRVTLGPWLAQVHTYPVGTWNSSDSVSKCFATLKNGTHLHWYTPTLWVHGTAQSLSQSALQLTRMAPIFTGQLVHTYPVGTWNSSESASKCFATHKNGTHLHCVQDPRVTLGPWLAQVHTYPVGTWNSSESASKCFATHKNGTHLHWSACTHLPCGYMEQLRVCLKVLCNSQEWHPSPLVSLKVLMSCGHTPSVPDPRVTLGPWLAQVHTYPVGTWNSSESVSKCFATLKNGTHLHWYTPTLWVHGTAQSLSQSALQLTRMAPIFTGQLVHTYPVGTWNSSESASKCFATHKNGTHLHWYTPTLWVHGTAQSLPQSALQLTRMAPISTGELESTYELWSHPQCSGSTRDVGSLVGAGTHLPCGYMEQLRVCLKVLCNSQEWHPSPLVSLKVLMSCGHTPSVLDLRVTLGPWLAQVHTYPVGTWNSSESVSKCFATHKNGTHLHWYTPTLWVHGTAQSLPQSALQLTRMAPISTGELESTYELWSHPQCSGSTHDVGSLVGAGTHLPCGYMEQLRVCLKVLCNSQEWHPSPLVSLKVLMSCGHTPSVPDPRVTLGPWLAQVHTYPVGTWNSSESASKCFATHKNGTHLHW